MSIVAITDHHTIDVIRFEELRSLAGDDLTFFPGIELRCELGGKEAIHYIGIFPETANVRDLWASLQGKLDITPSQVTSKTDERVWVPYDRGSKAIRELGGLVSIHAGKKTNSFENIKNDPKFKQLVKTEILRDCVDILEVQSDGDCRGYLDIVFPSVGFRRPIVVGSDNHDIRNYSTKCPCWVRGDATFEALKYVCCEPDDRLFLGESPPLLERVTNNRTRYIRSVAIRKLDDAQISEKWFDCEVPLNHGLVAIIGNKGGGKSAFADIIGLLGDSHAGDDFSFLTAEKFCKPNNNKAKSFNGVITWESDGTSNRPLSDRVTAEVESVKYLPQEYIEGVCNELQEYGGGRFSEELASVIFSHVELSDRLNCSTFDELLQYKTAEKLKAVDVRRESLNTLIASLVAQERLSSPSHIQAIKEQIAAKTRELDAHDATKPVEVPKPVEDEAARVATDNAEKQIAELTLQADELRKKLETANQLLTVANRRMAAADRLTTRLASFETEVSMLKEQSGKDCADLGLSIDDIVKVTVDKARIAEAQNAATEQSQSQSKIVDPEPLDSIARQVAAIEKQMAEIRNALAGPSKKYQQYLIELKNWRTRRDAIVGPAEKDGTLRFYEKQLADCDTAAKDVPFILEQVMAKAIEVYGDLTSLAAVYSDLYAPVQRFIEKHPLAKAQFHMSFETKIVERRFAEDFLSHIAQNRRGSFNGSIEGRERINGLLGEADFNAPVSAAEFQRKVWHALHNDLRNDPATPSHVTDQLAKGSTTQHLYEHVFGFKYLSPFFTLRWAGKDVQQLSPGERGTLLLVFYLLIDRSDIPLIIDQPEENLDNQTVYNVLVPSIKEARGRRQLIIVTHNPNLAVVCDADQVICASIDKEDLNKVIYDAGAIENPRINKRILDILEGTRPAFDNRDSKYHPQL